MLVGDYLEQSARRWPDKIALSFGNQNLTYTEIDGAANRLANYLLARGVQRSDRVAIFLDNSVEAVISAFGVLKAGAVFIMVSGSTKSDKLTFVLNNCRAVGLITHHRKTQVVNDSLPLVQSLHTTLWTGAGDGGMSFAAA